MLGQKLLLCRNKDCWACRDRKTGENLCFTGATVGLCHLPQNYEKCKYRKESNTRKTTLVEFFYGGKN